MADKKPMIIINPNDTKPYTRINWQSYLGMEVDVVYHKDQNIVVPQFVTSRQRMISEDKSLSNLIDIFLSDARLKFDAFYKLAEMGRWIVSGNKPYLSDVFTSYSINSIKPEDALPALAKTIDQSLSYETEDDLQGLILVHTHPIANAPLSPGDINSLNIIGEQLGLEEGDKIQLIAIPINQKGGLIFRYVLEK